MSIDCHIKQVTKRTVIGKTTIDGRPQSNAGAIALGDFIIAIDPSPEANTAPIFRKKIEEHFQLPVKYLLVTHYHGDHLKGASAFKDCIILTSTYLCDHMKEKRKSPLPELLFDDKLVIKNGPYEVEFYYAGGHTICSTYAYFPREKVIFLGDLLFADEFPWAGDASSNPDQWIAFYEEVLKMDYEYIVPGHGPLCDKAEAEKQLKLLKELRDNTLKALEENKNPTEITRSTIYEKASESRVTRTLQHFHDFYSKKTKN